MMKIEQIDKETFDLNTLTNDNINDYFFITRIPGCGGDMTINRLSDYNADYIVRKLRKDNPCALVKITFEKITFEKDN